MSAPDRMYLEGKRQLPDDTFKPKRRPDDEQKKWGVLKPVHGNSHPEIELVGHIFPISKNTTNNISMSVFVDCNFVFDEDRNKGFVEVTSPLGCVYVNQKPVRKGHNREKVILEDGNEIGFYFQEPYIFRFYYYDGDNACQYPEEVSDEKPRQAQKHRQSATTRMTQTPSITELINRLVYHPNPTLEDNSDVWSFVLDNVKTQLRTQFEFCLTSSDEEAEFFSRNKSIARTLLVTAPTGADLFLKRLLKRVSDEMNVPMLEIDCTLLGAVDGVEQECSKNFQTGDRVKYIGKGKSTNEELLGRIGKVLYVSDGKVAVNFESNSNEYSGAFVEVDLLGGVDEEVPKQDRRLIGRLPEILNAVPKMIVVLQRVDEFFQTKSDVSTEIRSFINDFKKRTRGILVGCSASSSAVKSGHAKQIPQVDPGLCMFGEKEMKMVDGYGVKGQSHGKSISKTLSKMFGNTINIATPTGESARGWWIMMQEDGKKMRGDRSKKMLKSEISRYGIELEENEDISIDNEIKKEDAEKIIGWAIGKEISTSNEKVKVIKKENLLGAIEMEKLLNPTKDAVDMLEAENDFEKKLMSDVVRSADVDVSFDDIGALEKVKETLYDSITLPLLRPELFKKGSLTKRSKGILFFGPPGTGKTMLAKAVAKESKANFINASLSSLESKWFGEAEKFVKALFSLAEKLSPCVIFIDEVDALLGKRTSQNENETLRKMKNEFMTLWDGLKSKNMEQIIVLGATNRPFDLDDAILRRFSRRILVDLPTKEDRENILKVILKGENTAVDISKIAEKTNGYSGCDLFNLSCAAAMRPLRDYLKSEEKKGEKEVMKKEESKKIDIRPIDDNDFLEVLSTMNPSTNKDSPLLTETRNWNEQFGEGKTGSSEIISYFI
ncbi:hypothetical protein EIN_487260 [Entamoeba invadens IP1]|uniref:AAA+ ATPase domain-containing protein n=1 Tax=Entamoeba invadens IP1 TaxID=370355 RepID=A0A0A1U4Y6_ENTIV|nr:hypothetical protein EIN_487260 [Entamoeba invadens IP1]ELP89244.1 hypothetical protein EIN_487260 [Entamoeba invadens IP1]|eukprot:XP_004256015.1 hypothetical protein EIN_487260 [Entamoeba invadens IP1]